MRSDDAAGVHAAHRLEERYRDCGELRVIAAHQLTPELAEDIADVNRVLFLDASATGRPGDISETSVTPLGVLGALDHHVNPGTLLVFAEQLYGEAPLAFALTITGASFAVGTGITPPVAAKIDELERRAVALIESWLGTRSASHSETYTAHSL
jgi:hydrogenase maturation protease